MPDLLDPSSLPLAASLAVFGAAAAVVWLAGTRLSGYAEAIAERTGIGRAFLGALMLGGITSLPELATTLSASLRGHPEMAVNNIFGGVAMQVAVLAIADAAIRRRAISTVPRQAVVLLQGVLLILLLALTVAAILVGEPAGLAFGPWTAAVFAAALVAFRLMHRYEGHAGWEPITREGREEGGRTSVEVEARRRERAADATPRRAGDSADREAGGEGGEGEEGEERPSLGGLIARSAAAALGIVAAGTVLTLTGEGLAAQTGLGSSFVGVALIAVATSLPEISTTVAAARLHRYDMAFSNIFGANLLDVALLFPTDLVYAGPPVMNGVGRFAAFAALLAIVLTAVFLAGILRRRVPTYRRLGADSILVLVLYVAGLYALYTMR